MEDIQLQVIIKLIEDDLLIQITSGARTLVDRRLTYDTEGISNIRLRPEVFKAFREAFDKKMRGD